MGETATKSDFRNYLNWPLLGIILAWGVLITQVRHHWGGESYYNFGMFVPFLAIWLWLRNFESFGDPKPVHSRLPLVLAGLAILFVLPFQALSEVNPFWRLPLWIQATGLVAFSGATFYAVYGWGGVLRSVFPIFFLCMMIPWPWRLEVYIVQSLTNIVVTVAMDILHFIGYPVELAGNNLVLGELSIGVSDACSGIRSLQALFMVTLFLGSIFGQGIWRRVAALLILPLIVIVVNAFRATFLALQVIENGYEAYDNWHDPAGYIAFGISMLLIYICIELLNFGAKRETDVLGVSREQLKTLLARPRIPAAITYAILPVLMYAVVEGWFRFKEMNAPEATEWSFNTPPEAEGVIEYQPISKMVEEALGYDYSTHFYFHSGNDIGSVYYYGYTEDNKLSSVSSYGHKPTICMEAIGATMVEQFPNLRVEMDGLVLPMHHYLFQLHNGVDHVHVFWIVWEKRNMGIDPDRLEDLDYTAQLRQLRQGRRDFSRKVLLISLASNSSEERAKTRVLPLLKEWINPQAD